MLLRMNVEINCGNNISGIVPELCRIVPELCRNCIPFYVVLRLCPVVPFVIFWPSISLYLCFMVYNW